MTITQKTVIDCNRLRLPHVCYESYPNKLKANPNAADLAMDLLSI